MNDLTVQPFNKLVLDNIDGKPIYLINYSLYYLTELCDMFSILPFLAGGWDHISHRQGNQVFRGHEIRIINYGDICEVLSDAILLILDSYPLKRFQWLQSKGDFLKQEW